MILRQTATGFDLSPELEKYARAKAKQVGRKIPRRERKHALCHIDFKRKSKGERTYNTCSIIVEFANTQLRATETTQHMYASLDVATVHMQHQLHDYVRRHQDGGYRRLLSLRRKR